MQQNSPELSSLSTNVSDVVAHEQLQAQLQVALKENERLRQALTTALQAQASSQTQQSHLTQLLDYLDEFVWVRDAHTGEYLYGNLATEAVYGRNFSELLEHPKLWLNIVHPDDYAQVEAAHTALFDVGHYCLTYRIVLPDGTSHWVRDRAQVIWDNKTPVRIEGVTTKLPNATKPDRPHCLISPPCLGIFETALSYVADMVMITEAEPATEPGPRIVYVNPAFTNVTGYSADEITGRNPSILYGSLTDPAQVDKFYQALQHQQPMQTELICYRKDGIEFWSELAIAPIFEVTGTITYWLIIQRDVSEQKQIETQILKALVRETELNELKSRFISMASHEFRTPLTTIMSSTDLLEHFTFDRSDQQELFGQIRQAIRHLVQLLDDVLFISHVDTKKPTLEGMPVNLGQFCEALVREVVSTAGQHHNIICQPPISDIYININDKLLRQILTNLLSNSIKYSPANSTIWLNMSCQNDQAILQVQDQGIGIPDDDRRSLFEYFHRAGNVGTIVGVGLGLAIVKKCVDFCDGTIEVDSIEGVGTTFTVKLPLQFSQELQKTSITQDSC